MAKFLAILFDIAEVYLLGKTALSMSRENKHFFNYEFFDDEREKIIKLFMRDCKLY
jgi:hypothetical protein